MKYIHNWQEIIDLNETNLPLTIGGYPRSGTTFSYRSLYNFFKDKMFLEQYFNTEYQYRQSTKELFIDIAATKAKKSGLTGIESMKHNKPISSLKKYRYYHYLENYENWDKAFIKSITFDLHDLLVEDPKAYYNFLKSHWWLYTIRKDWFNMILSNLYGEHFKKFHYYDDEPLKTDPFEQNIDDLKFYKKQFTNLMHIMKNSKGYLMYTEDISHLNIEHPLVRLPRYDENKSELFKSVFLNYDELYDSAYKMAKEVESETNEFFKFTKKEVIVNGIYT